MVLGPSCVIQRVSGSRIQHKALYRNFDRAESAEDFRFVGNVSLLSTVRTSR